MFVIQLTCSIVWQQAVNFENIYQRQLMIGQDDYESFCGTFET